MREAPTAVCSSQARPAKAANISGRDLRVTVIQCIMEVERVCDYSES